MHYSAEELAVKKKMVEQRLREKEKRLSRLSQAINGNSSASKQTQQDVNHMAEKLKKMQNLLAKNEQVYPSPYMALYVVFIIVLDEKGRRARGA